MPSRKSNTEPYNNTPEQYYKVVRINGIDFICYGEWIFNSYLSCYLTSHRVMKLNLTNGIKRWWLSWPEEIRRIVPFDSDLHEKAYRPLHLLGLTDADMKRIYYNWKETTWRKLEDSISALETILSTPLTLSRDTRDELSRFLERYKGQLKSLRPQKANYMKLYTRGFFPLVSMFHQRGLNAYRIQKLLMLFLEEFDFPLSHDFERHKRIYKSIRELGFPEYFERQDKYTTLNS